MTTEEMVFAAPSSIHGTGLFARVPLRPSAYVGTYQGPEARRDGKYVLWVYHEDGRVVGRRGQNILRYLNHSESPNTEFDGFDLYTLRAIAPGEELTIDYNGA